VKRVSLELGGKSAAIILDDAAGDGVVPGLVGGAMHLSGQVCGARTRVAAGGVRPSGLLRGWYVAPTILADADNSMRVAREEIFGPMLCLLAYDGEDDAVRIASDSAYGLAALERSCSASVSGLAAAWVVMACYPEGLRPGGIQAWPLNRSRRAASLLMPHLAAVDR